MLQLRQEFLEGLVTFLFEHNKDDHEDGVSPPMRVQGQNLGQVPILKISKFDIGLIKMLFCPIAKVEPLILKMKI